MRAARPRSIVGVLGGLEVGPYGECGVLPHERITPKASTDRLDLTRATRANMSPIWGLSLADGLTELLDRAGEPIASVTIDGVEHTVERVSDPDRIAAISAKIATDDVLIADGHHRYGVAQKFRDEMREATGSDTTDAEDTLVFVSELVEDQLSVEAIHRLYADVHVDDLVAALDEGFDRSPAGTPVGRDARRDGRTRRAVSGAPRRQRASGSRPSPACSTASVRSTACGSRSCSPAWSTP